MVSARRTEINGVATEYGVVNWLGNSQRGRAEWLISIAHPDVCAELQAAAKRLFWP